MVKDNKKTFFANPVKTIFSLVIVSMLITLAGTINSIAADTWYVSNEGLDTNDGTSWGDAFPTIQQGVTAASDGDIVIVADGTYTGTGNKDIQLQGKAITVQSLNGPENCFIDCENSGRGFYIHEGEGPDTIVSGFTIQNGNVGSAYGGAIYCYDSSTPTIKNCIIKNNTGGFGGGIGCLYAGATITNCQIINNTSSYGGGIYSIFPWVTTDNLVIVNCIISGNNASISGGGIIYGGFSTTAYLAVINSTIVGNTAANGGGIYLDDCKITNVTNTISWDNTPDNILVNICTPAITYSDLQGGYTGTGNINLPPDFVDSINGDFRLSAGSDCIDAGNNSVTGILNQDLDGKPRFIDGDDNMLALVDMGAYEYGDIGECDFNEDLDVDGADLSEFINDSAGYTLADFVEDFGRADCPYYSYIPIP